MPSCRWRLSSWLEWSDDTSLELESWVGRDVGVILELDLLRRLSLGRGAEFFAFALHVESGRLMCRPWIVDLLRDVGFFSKFETHLAELCGSGMLSVHGDVDEWRRRARVPYWFNSA